MPFTMASMLQSFLFKRHVEDDEVVTRIVHRHWAIGLKIVFWPLFSLVVAWGLFAWTLAQPILVLTLLWTAGASVWLLRNFFDYYLDAWIITDKGVIDLAWFGWFHRQSTRVLYSDIQGVSYEIHGVLGTLLQFGTISIEKISSGSLISLPQVPMPKQVEALILSKMEVYMHSKNMKNAKHVEQLLSTFIAEQLNLRSMKKFEDSDPIPQIETEAISAAIKKSAKKATRRKKVSTSSES